MLRAGASVAAFPAIAVSVILIIFGAPILELMFGEGYGSAATLLVVLAVAQAIKVSLGPGGIALVMSGRQRSLLWVNFAFDMVAVLFGAVGANLWGILDIATFVGATRIARSVCLCVLAHIGLGVWSHAGVPRLSSRK